MRVTIIYTSETKKIITPRVAMNHNGATEKQVIPSIAYFIKLLKLHEDFPIWRSAVGKEIHFVLKPTHENIPLENR